MARGGDLILRNDDDDLPHPTGSPDRRVREHPDCDLAYGFARGIDACGPL
jgi:hypothetical protein